MYSNGTLAVGPTALQEVDSGSPAASALIGWNPTAEVFSLWHWSSGQLGILNQSHIYLIRGLWKSLCKGRETLGRRLDRHNEAGKSDWPPREPVACGWRVARDFQKVTSAARLCPAARCCALWQRLELLGAEKVKRWSDIKQKNSDNLLYNNRAVSLMHHLDYYSI